MQSAQNLTCNTVQEFNIDMSIGTAISAQYVVTIKLVKHQRSKVKCKFRKGTSKYI